MDLAKKLKNYSAELLFCYRIGNSLQDSSRLAKNVIQFHAYNRKKNLQRVEETVHKYTLSLPIARAAQKR